MHILQNAPWKLPSYSSHGKAVSHFLLYRELAANDGTAQGLLEGGTSLIKSSLLSDPLLTSLKQGVADLEKSLNQRNCEYPSLPQERTWKFSKFGSGPGFYT